ncbi:MAG TPA: GntR family transcriptional regulator [Halothiobacillus sp.]|nr:GntR family transcriptional regulator [Halothiobacillus sp.]
MQSEKNILHFSPVPLYTQIKEVLRNRILNGTYQCHDQMPSESELTKIFGVSRITVRQALDHLQKEGLIFKIHGKGTYVSKPKVFQNLGKLQGFGEAMSGMGYEIVSELIDQKVIPADKTVSLKLNVNKDELVYEIRRVRYLNRSPLSLDVTYIPKAIGERLVKEDLAHRDIFLILENDYGYSLGQADLQIESILADDVLAELLHVDAGAPILRIERLTFTTNNQPLDFEYLYYRGDAIQYRLRIERGPI